MYRLSAVLLIMICPQLAWGSAVEPGPVAGKLFRVVNTTTVVVHSESQVGDRGIARVTLADIDAPSLEGRCMAEKNLAIKARMLLMRYVGLDVNLYDLQFDQMEDRSIAHVIGRVLLADGSDLGETLIYSGLARRASSENVGSWCPDPPKRESRSWMNPTGQNSWFHLPWRYEIPKEDSRALELPWLVKAPEGDR